MHAGALLQILAGTTGRAPRRRTDLDMIVIQLSIKSLSASLPANEKPLSTVETCLWQSGNFSSPHVVWQAGIPEHCPMPANLSKLQK